MRTKTSKVRKSSEEGKTLRKKQEATAKSKLKRVKREATSKPLTSNKKLISPRAEDINERRQVEEKYRNIFENAMEAITQTTPEGRYITVNPSAARMLGYQSTEEMIAHTTNLDSQFYVKPGRREEFKNLMNKYDFITGFESEVYCKDGNTIWISENSRTVRDGHGNLLYYEGTALDITEQKRAEEEIKNSETRYRRMFESSKDCILILDAYTGYIIDANPLVTELLGYTLNEFLGKKLWKFDLFKDIVPNQHAFQELQQNKNVHYENLPLQAKDGTTVFVEFISNAYDVSGIEVIQCNIRDITGRKQAEDELRQSEQKYQSLVEQIPVVIYEAESRGHSLYISPQVEKFTGFSSAEWLADHGLWFKQLHPEDKQRVLEENARALAEKRKYVLEYRIIKKDGGIIWIHDEGEPVRHTSGALPRFRGIWQDITERKRAEEKIQQQLERLGAIAEIDRSITSNFDLQFSLSTLLSHVAKQLGVDAADVLLLSPGMNMLEYAAGHGFRTKSIETSRIRLGEGYAGRAALKRQQVRIPNLKVEPDNQLLVTRLADEGFVSYYGTPLIAKGKVKGVLEVFQRSRLEPDAEWLAFLDALAGQAAIAIDSYQLFEGLQKTNSELRLAYDTTIEGWSHALDLRDKETEGHTQRVVQMTLELARAAGMSEEELVNVRRGALLHDIGKMGVPDHILLKPDELNDEEWLVMSKHPEYAYELLSPIDYLRPALDIPYCHHEKWDGTGYPRGLKGEQIPLMARLFAVVDVWDALRSDRPYRKSWPKEKVFEHIRSLAGTYFDPHAVELFFSEFDE